MTGSRRHVVQYCYRCQHTPSSSFTHAAVKFYLLTRQCRAHQSMFQIHFCLSAIARLQRRSALVRRLVNAGYWNPESRRSWSTAGPADGGERGGWSSRAQCVTRAWRRQLAFDWRRDQNNAPAAAGALPSSLSTLCIQLYSEFTHLLSEKLDPAVCCV